MRLVKDQIKGPKSPYLERNTETVLKNDENCYDIDLDYVNVRNLTHVREVS